MLNININVHNVTGETKYLANMQMPNKTTDSACWTSMSFLLPVTIYMLNLNLNVTFKSKC